MKFINTTETNFNVSVQDMKNPIVVRSSKTEFGNMEEPGFFYRVLPISFFGVALLGTVVMPLAFVITLEVFITLFSISAGVFFADGAKKLSQKIDQSIQKENRGNKLVSLKTHKNLWLVAFKPKFWFGKILISESVKYNANKDIYIVESYYNGFIHDSYEKKIYGGQRYYFNKALLNVGA